VGYESTTDTSQSAAAARLDVAAARFRTSALDRALNEYWGTWSLPSPVSRRSGAPTFVDDAREKRARRLVAVVSDGGKDCACTDARVRVDTIAMQNGLRA
jgi:hypothetical protein